MRALESIEHRPRYAVRQVIGTGSRTTLLLRRFETHEEARKYAHDRAGMSPYTEFLVTDEHAVAPEPVPAPRRGWLSRLLGVGR